MNRSSALLDALAPLAAHELVAEVRGGVGTMAAVELTAEVRDRRPGAVASLARGARAAGVLVRPGGTAIAVSPPLTAGPEHFELIADGIARGLSALAATRSWRHCAKRPRSELSDSQRVRLGRSPPGAEPRRG